jgi:hypothetical protein
MTIFYNGTEVKVSTSGLAGLGSRVWLYGALGCGFGLDQSWKGGWARWHKIESWKCPEYFSARIRNTRKIRVQKKKHNLKNKSQKKHKYSAKFSSLRTYHEFHVYGCLVCHERLRVLMQRRHTATLKMLCLIGSLNFSVRSKNNQCELKKIIVVDSKCFAWSAPNLLKCLSIDLLKFKLYFQ